MLQHQHRCTHCFKIFDCMPCIDPKRHGRCSKMPYEYKLTNPSTGVSVQKTITMYFCKSDCLIECMAMVEVTKLAIDRILMINRRLEEILLNAKSEEEADFMVDELFAEIEMERKDCKRS